MVARRTSTTLVDPQGLAPLLACRLIAMDKNPGIRPIGIGETIRWIMNKAILRVTGPWVQEDAGTVQLCAGQESGCEAAVHAMNKIVDDDKTEAIMLIDATNVFNSLNRKSALLNIRSLCPPLASVLINTYRENVDLFIDGETLHSQAPSDIETARNHQTSMVCGRSCSWGQTASIAKNGIWLLPQCQENVDHCEATIPCHCNRDLPWLRCQHNGRW